MKFTTKWGRKDMKKLLVSAVISVLSLTAKADDISIGMPGVGGSGCPQGSVSATLTPDNKTLSVIFDQFVVEAGKAYGPALQQRKFCDMAIPVHVPQGLSVGIIKVDYRGYMFIPKGGLGRFDVEYFLKSPTSSSRRLRYAKDFPGYADTDFLLSNTLGLESVVWSACGEDVNLRISSTVTARTNSKREDTIATLDSTDLSASLIYQLQWKKCN
jgi:hypothetical protein